MRRTALFITGLLLLAAGSALAGSPMSPEIEDDRGDLTSQYWLHATLLDDGPEDLSPSQAQAINASADLLGAWVHGENDEMFMLTIEVADLPDLENVSGPLVDISAFFTIGNDQYDARTELSVPAETQDIQASYSLWEDGTEVTSLAGNLDNETDRITLLIPKDAVGDPVFGDTLTEFYATSSLADGGFILDYAPGQPKVDVVTGDLADPTLQADPAYGDTYEFGQYEGAVPSAIDASATPSSLVVQAGEKAKVAIQVANQAEQADTVTLAVADRPSGWTVELDETTLDLDPGQSQVATLTIGTPNGASGQEILALSLLSSPLGADIQLPISVQLQPASGTGGGDTGTSTGGTGDDGATDDAQTGTDPGGAGTSPGTDGGQASDQEGEQAPDDEEENGAPVAPVAMIVAAVAAAALATRTGRG